MGSRGWAKMGKSLARFKAKRWAICAYRGLSVLIYAYLGQRQEHGKCKSEIQGFFAPLRMTTFGG
jgi:hypothetical protein